MVAGGSGKRFGRAKQYERLGARRVIDIASDVAGSISAGVVIVVPPGDVPEFGPVAGGETRSASVRAGLAAVPESASIICVHDAARPFATVALYRAVIDAVDARCRRSRSRRTGDRHDQAGRQRRRGGCRRPSAAASSRFRPRRRSAPTSCVPRTLRAVTRPTMRHWSKRRAARSWWSVARSTIERSRCRPISSGLALVLLARWTVGDEMTH